MSRNNNADAKKMACLCDSRLRPRRNRGAGCGAINRMEANAWTKETVKPGDVITGIGYQYSDGQNIMGLGRVCSRRVRRCSSTAVSYGRAALISTGATTGPTAVRSMR
jgi:hypothetical protein